MKGIKMNNNDCPADVAVEYPHGTMFLRPVEGVLYETQDTDEWTTIEQRIDQALDCARLDVVEQLSKHI